jgi:hypothetical protein
VFLPSPANSCGKGYADHLRKGYRKKYYDAAAAAAINPKGEHFHNEALDAV